MSTENTNAELWAVHAQGPDDIYPAYDRADAERHAAELNAIPTPPGISVAAVVVPSPLAPLEHWKGVAELEREHKLHLLAGVAPTDANLSAMRKEGLSLEGDNTYKRDLLDAVVGAMGFGKQRMPPPAGHWLWRFYDIGVAEADERDKLRAELAELKGGQVMGRVYDGKAELNSIGRQLPDHAELFAAAPAPVQQADSKRRIAAAQEWLKGVEQEYGEEIADKCENILYQAEAARKQQEQQADHSAQDLNMVQQVVRMFGDEIHVSIPRSLIGAACSAIDKKRDAPNILAELRRYTFGDLAQQAGYMAGAPLLSTAAQDVLAERNRQITAEGWTPAHDDAYGRRELAMAAACYAAAVPEHKKLDCDSGKIDLIRPERPSAWPWDKEWWKPGAARRNLVKAGALILAEIERLDRGVKAGTL
jgi:hypothetical protein